MAIEKKKIAKLGNVANCGTCRFWMCWYGYPSSGEGAAEWWNGECRRHAPLKRSDRLEPTSGIWPTTNASAWCGDFEPCHEEEEATT